MPHIAGDKIAGDHTTIIESAEPLVTGLQQDPRVNTISLGPIDNTTGGHTGKPRVKIIDEQTAIIMSVSGSGSHQIVRVFLHALSKDREEVKSYIKKLADNHGYGVTFLDRR